MQYVRLGTRKAAVLLGVGMAASVTSVVYAAPPKTKRPAAAAPPKAAPAASVRTTPVGIPQDAGPHDATSAIEWWYYNAFLTSQTGHRYALVASFFRTGLPSQRKGHYLIYSLADLDKGTQQAFSVMDKAEANLLKAYLPLISLQKPDDPRPLVLLSQLQNNTLPEPHRLLPNAAVVRTKPVFSVTMEESVLSQASPDGRVWNAALSSGSGSDDWTLDLTLTQPEDRPAMLVGGIGKTGLSRPDDMFYLSLTGMKAEGNLTSGGVVEKLTGTGWLDRQWGTSWIVQDNGWDWFGLHLSDGSELIVYRVRDNKTGKILRSDATLLAKDGTQMVESAPLMALGEAVSPAEGATATAAAAPTLDTGDARWTDPASGIVYPVVWTITLPKSGLTLTVKPFFRDQAIPVVGIGDAIWEGAVSVSGSTKAGTPVTGEGYMELVGYKKPTAAAVPPPKR